MAGVSVRTAGACAALLTLGLAACDDDEPAVEDSPDAGEQPLRPCEHGTDAGTRKCHNKDSDAGVHPAAPCEPDDSAEVQARDRYGEWIPVELDGTFCSDGSPYKFFVNYSRTRNDLAIMFEPGGACWDFETCTGQARRGAANPNGIPDDHMDTWGVAYPAWADLNLGEASDGTPLALLSDYNKVFLPYCTGDVFAGNIVRTYESEDGTEQVMYRHVGHRNLLKVVEWLDATFETVPRLMVGGCSAGGAGALINYHHLRQGITGSQCGYLVSDSGPLFPGTGPSAPLQSRIREAWDTERTLATFRPLAEAAFGESRAEVVMDDPGAISDVLAATFPRDRLSVTLYRWDFNYSLYSYDSFYDMQSDEEVFDLWGEDLDNLIAQYDRHPNLAYYIAFARPDNCSHCLSIAPLDHIPQALAGQPYLGTEIEEYDVDLHDFYVEVLDDAVPLRSYHELEPPAAEGLTPSESAACR